VVHLVRDPFDTAVSSYLYHSQDPTPEKWVYKLQGPCKADERAQAFLADVLRIPPSALLNVSKLYRQLYRSAMPAGRPANNYFEAMRALSVEDSVCAPRPSLPVFRLHPQTCSSHTHVRAVSNNGSVRPRTGH
jgi:hypothetical protein